MVEECVDEGAVGVAGRWVDDHAVGLMEDNDVRILEKDVERDVLRGCDVRDSLGDDDGDGVTLFY